MNFIFSNLLVLVLLMAGTLAAWGQKATVSEELKSFTTYPYGDPNPIPILSNNPKIYPYYKFEGYNHQSIEQSWKVVTLENDYIQVFVLPEVGGKVWGAVDKTTGQEFIYRNEVMKFRNISMRGPWTSGGIEFNFGIIGHHPSTATPVDYLIRENEDGSVSCFVGNIDLSSRTHWRVEINLQPDKSYFETRSLWYNPTPHIQSYYNWMTGAAFATEDLEFFTPGNQYLKHSGEAMPWPLDNQGRNLARYAENNFGGSKSYHVVGEYNDFFGGYFHDQGYGFGHWSTYEEMPGQKLWIWALSRAGGIWEDLLTDEDGQYIEFQAGRLFDQYSPGDHQNPITQVPFGSYYSDTWRELWFPFNAIGGLSEVSPQAAMHVTRNNGQVTIGINALAHAAGNMVVKTNDRELLRKEISLAPTEIATESIAIPANTDFEVILEEMDLHYSSVSDQHQLKRPFQFPDFSELSKSTEAYRQGLEDLQFREFRKARASFEACLEQDPSHIEARSSLAEILFRNAEYDAALEQVNLALSIDTYRAHTNYVAGNVYRAMGDHINAMESFGWAARSMEFRSAAYTQMAEMTLAKNSSQEAEKLAMKALDFNAKNVSALEVLTVINRLQGDNEPAMVYLSRLLDTDPLNHLGHYEMAMFHPTYRAEEHFKSEFPEQTYLELAIRYFNMGQQDVAKRIFSSTDHTVARIWMAYLEQDDTEVSDAWLAKVKDEQVEFVFPYRSETLSPLQWVETKDNHWKFKYYLGLVYWGMDRLPEAAQLWSLCEFQPDEAVFYLSRALLLNELNSTDQLQDLEKAMSLEPMDWRVSRYLINYYGSNGNYSKELALSEAAKKKWPDNYDLGLSYATSLLNNKKYARCISQLKRIDILPFEGAGASRTIYERAYLGEALRLMDKGQYKKAVTLLEEAKLWPENLGVGKPYRPEQRQIDYLLGVCYQNLSQVSNLEVSHQALQDYTLKYYANGHPANILGLMSLSSSGKSKEVKSIVETLKTSERLADQWVVAQYNQDDTAIRNLSDRIDQADPLGYELLTRIIQIR